MLAARPKLRLTILVGLIGGLFLLASHAMPHSPAGLRATFAGYGALGPAVFVVVWVGLTPALVSGTLLAAASGLLFGVAIGTCVAIAGATLGGVVAFLIARRAGGDAVARAAGPRVARLTQRLERRAFRSVVLLRLAPGLPTTILNYAVGLTRVPLRTFALATAVGGAPRIFVYVAVGGALANGISTALLPAAGAFAALSAVAGVAALRSRRWPGEFESHSATHSV